MGDGCIGVGSVARAPFISVPERQGVVVDGPESLTGVGDPGKRAALSG